MRIAVGGFHTESSTYNPVLLTEADFAVIRGAPLLDAPAFQFLSRFDATFLPTLYARALPGGPIEAGTYNRFRDEFLERLKSLGRVDGLYLALHGAAAVEGLSDAEADFVSAARAAVGPDCLIAVSYDLHGNLSSPIVDAIDIFSAYRTAPHIDVERTMHKAVEMLLASLRSGERSHVTWCPVPVLLPGEMTATTDEPAASLYSRLPAIDEVSGIWDASLLVGYVWADQARATAASVVTGTDQSAVKAAAVELGRMYWSARDQFQFGVETGTLEQCLDKALSARSSPVILADSGDNPTAGAIGDRADVLGMLIARSAKDAIVAAIADQPTVERSFQAGFGNKIVTTIGASIHPRSGPCVETEAIVEFLSEAENARDREAVLRIGGIRVVVSATRRPYHSLADFARLKLDATKARLLVVKSGYLAPELAEIANPAIMALTPGAADQHVERLDRPNKVRPTFPFDRSFEWIPEAQLSQRASGQT